MSTTKTVKLGKALNTTSPVTVCDYRNAYLHFEIDIKKQPTVTVTTKQPFTLNHVRIPLECRCFLDGVEYVLGAACKTERVNVHNGVWTQPNADFNPVASKEHFMIIKYWDHRERRVLNSMSGGDQPRRQSGLASEAWASHRIDAPSAAARQLKTSEEVWNTVLANRPIVCRTSFKTDDGLSVLLEYPMKTVNVSNRDQFYQSDTGPLLVPMPVSRPDSMIERFYLAYLAQSGNSWAEFIVNTPTKITEDVSVDHYSTPLRVDAQNEWFVLD